MSYACENFDTKKRHEELCNYIHKDLWIPKNDMYGDSFHKLFADLGIISAVTQITHKYNRLKNLSVEMSQGKLRESDESIHDTLLDMANYCIMTAMELEREALAKSSKA